MATNSNVGLDGVDPYAEDGANGASLRWDGRRFSVVDGPAGLGVTFVNGVVMAATGEAALTPFADMSPVPRVVLDIPASMFPPGSVTVGLTRTADGRTFDVRGGQALPAGVPAVVTDAEAPFGVVSAYTVTGYDATGNIIGSIPVGSVILEFDEVVIQQPLDARLSAVVDRLRETGTATSRETPFQIAYPQGSALPGMVGLGPRRGFAGVEWELLVDSHETADRLQATLGTYDEPQLPVWLIRTPVDTKNPSRTQRIPRVFFCAVTSLVEHDTYRLTDTGFVRFTAVTTEVNPPVPGITATVLTHSDIKALFTTHTEVKAQYATHSDLKRDQSLIGAADA